MMNFKVLQEGYMLAERVGNKELAARFRDQIEELQRSQPESVAPLDAARFKLSQIEQKLCLPPPGGYEAAITGLHALQEQFPAVEKEPSFHVFWAAALGQKYAYEKKQGAEQSALQSVVAEALLHIRQARYAGQTDWLQYLADPERGAKAQTADDDLVEIAKRPEVRREIGLS